MSAIWKNIEITWNNETYTIKPTLGFISELEQKPGRSLSKMFMRAIDADLPSSAACELIADTLKYAGAKDVTARDVFFATRGGVDSIAIELAIKILVGCMPAPDDEDEEKNTDKKKPTHKKALKK
jgi:hypothetical protein